MATRLKPEAEPTALMLVPVAVPDVEMPTLNQQVALILTSPEEGDVFYDAIKAKVEAFVPDLSTAKGRAECIWWASQVTKTKTAIESGSKELTEEARKFTASINAARKPMIERLAALAAKVRQPVTEWEAAEEARITRCRATIDQIRIDQRIAEDDTWQTVRARGVAIEAIPITTGEFGTLFDEASFAKSAAIATLSAAMKRLHAAEVAAAAAAEEAARNLAELEKLRAEKAARDAQDEADRVAEEARLAAVAAAEAEEMAAQQARDRAEADRIAAEERAETERLADLEHLRLAEEAAAEAAREEERALAQAEQDRRDAAAQALIDEANARAAAAEAESDRQAKEAQDAIDAAAAIEAEAAAERQRNAEDRMLQMKLNIEAIRAIGGFGIQKEDAGRLVDAIRDDLIPHIKWEA